MSASELNEIEIENMRIEIDLAENNLRRVSLRMRHLLYDYEQSRDKQEEQKQKLIARIEEMKLELQEKLNEVNNG